MKGLTFLDAQVSMNYKFAEKALNGNFQQQLALNKSFEKCKHCLFISLKVRFVCAVSSSLYLPLSPSEWKTSAKVSVATNQRRFYPNVKLEKGRKNSWGENLIIIIIINLSASIWKILLLSIDSFDCSLSFCLDALFLYGLMITFFLSNCSLSRYLSKKMLSFLPFWWFSLSWCFLTVFLDSSFLHFIDNHFLSFFLNRCSHTFFLMFTFFDALFLFLYILKLQFTVFTLFFFLCFNVCWFLFSLSVYLEALFRGFFLAWSSLY